MWRQLRQRMKISHLPNLVSTCVVHVQVPSGRVLASLVKGTTTGSAHMLTEGWIRLVGLVGLELVPVYRATHTHTHGWMDGWMDGRLVG